MIILTCGVSTGQFPCGHWCLVYCGVMRWYGRYTVCFCEIHQHVPSFLMLVLIVYLCETNTCLMCILLSACYLHCQTRELKVCCCSHRLLVVVVFFAMYYIPRLRDRLVRAVVDVMSVRCWIDYCHYCMLILKWYHFVQVDWFRNHNPTESPIPQLFPWYMQFRRMRYTCN